ncbi:unnamed protein product, partial [Ixodes persulcatus]
KDKRLLARLRRKAWLLPLMHFQFWTSAAFSLIQPFYPALAASAGLEAWKYGFVFSTYKMAMLIASLSADRLVSRVANAWYWIVASISIAVFVFIFVLFAHGCNCRLELFSVERIFTQVEAMLHGRRNSFSIHLNVVKATIPPGTVYLNSKIKDLFFNEFTYNLYLMLKFQIVNIRTFCHHFHTAQSFPQSAIALGEETTDSHIGHCTIGATVQTSVPTWLSARRSISPNIQSNPKLRRLLWDPIFLIDIVTVMLCWVIMGFNEPTLEPYLRQFDLTSTEVGVVYMVQFSSYAFGSMASGLFCHFQMESFFSFAGQLMTAVAYLILGPAPFIPTSPSLWMIYVSQVLTGVGMSAQFICSYCHALKHATTRGYPDDVRTSGFVSSVVFTLLVFGAMTSPPIAGVLVDVFGYRKGSVFLFAILLVWVSF